MSGNDSDSMPPKTLEQLVKDIANKAHSSYVFIGEKADKGWKYALKAQQYIAALRVYRVAPAEAGDFRAKFGLKSSTFGVVFGFGKVVKKELPKAKTVKGMELLDVIRDSR